MLHGMGGVQPAISIRGLTKRYGRTLAVDNLTLDVLPGEIFGFLGLNGAGKTTTIRILLDLLRPTAGAAFVLGRDCRTESLAVRAAVGYLPGRDHLLRRHDGTAGARPARPARARARASRTISGSSSSASR